MNETQTCSICGVQIKVPCENTKGAVIYSMGEGDLNHLYSRICQFKPWEKEIHKGKSCLFKSLSNTKQINFSFEQASDTRPTDMR